MALALALVFVGATFARADEPVTGPVPPEPSGYRMEGYRSPTPATLAGATVLDTPGAEALWRGGTAVFVDVMPRPVRPPNLPAGTIWKDAPRRHLPGSVWLLNVGYGALPPEMEAFFRDSLVRLTGGDLKKPLAFYCRQACWMSWNAAKRAMALGYSAVHWYPDGTDGWEAAALPTEPAQPYALDAGR
ncbi:PQQ-dependent catabolism-associated CXXCW motif protein [Methylopila musalis]|uniref:PQQ-dependent catabolism-associated CXXCW motif protein n=1 Tax=Methylopila musalis TaxID=1134781 RepID=A0ABW3Z7C8_9HYPH